MSRFSSLSPALKMLPSQGVFFIDHCLSVCSFFPFSFPLFFYSPFPPFPLFFVCVCLFKHMRRTSSSVLPQEPSIFSEIRPLTGTWCSPIRLGWLASEPLESSSVFASHVLGSQVHTPWPGFFFFLCFLEMKLRLFCLWPTLY